MTPRLNLYGTVGRDFSSATVATWLASHPDAKTIDVHINSPGGDLFDGLTMHNALAAHPAKINVSIDGAALSAAGYVAMAGDTISIAKNGVFMLHEPSITSTGGNAADLDREAQKLRKLNRTMVDAYASRTRQEPDAIKAMLSADSGNGTWFDAEEAVAAGFADEISHNYQRVAAMVGDWTPPSRIAAFITDTTMSTKPNPESDLAQHAAFFDRHPQFFVEALKGGKTIADARSEYTAFVLDESDKLREKIKQLESNIESLSDGVDPLATNPYAAISNDPHLEPDELGDDATYKAEWEGNKPLRREFGGNFTRYAAYRRAEDAGLIRSPRKRG
ncbi:MAG: head maturation protease, ClpP-related [Planctomycetota bacterium]